MYDSYIKDISGAQQALYLIVQCLLKPGYAVAIEDPSYCFSLPIFLTAGLKIFRLPMDLQGVNPDDLIHIYSFFKNSLNREEIRLF